MILGMGTVNKFRLIMWKIRGNGKRHFRVYPMTRHGMNVTVRDGDRLVNGKIEYAHLTCPGVNVSLAIRSALMVCIDKLESGDVRYEA